MRLRCVAALVIAACVSAPGAGVAAGGCPGNPHAIGTSRVIAIDPADHTRIGSMQYPESLPLAHKEVVITFDDGPLPRYTNRILDTLESECVKATFFIVGAMADAYPAWVRRVYDAGHTVGTHSFGHPRFFRRLSYEKGVSEIERGIASVQKALGDTRPLAPFFRFPGFGSSRAFEAYLAGRGVMTWGADVPADDWKHISAAKIIERAISRLERKGRGILLLHDIQPATAQALPELLRELKARGFRVVHIVPAGPEHPKTVTAPQAWVFRHARVPEWPIRLPPNGPEGPAFSVPSPLSFGFPYPLADKLMIASFDGERPAMELSQSALAQLTSTRGRIVWPRNTGAQAAAAGEGADLPAPGLGELNEPSQFGGERFTPGAAAPGGRASLQARPTAIAATATKRRPRRQRIVAAEPPREPLVLHEMAAARHEHPPAWARVFNWFSGQPE